MVSSNVMSGAGSAFLRLHAALRARNVDVDLMYFRGPGPDTEHCFRRALPTLPGYDRLLQIVRRKLNRRWKSTETGFRTFDIGVRGVASGINQSSYDLIHLGWVSDTITSAEMRKISKPLVITMFDMNLVLGTYHYSSKDMFESLNCEGNSKSRWIEKFIFQRKCQNLNQLGPGTTITSPSELIASYAERSRSFARRKVFRTSNLTPRSFYPKSPDPAVLNRYGISIEAKNILFFSRDRGDRRKGAHLLEDWGREISKLPNARIIRIGRSQRTPTRQGVFHDIDFINSEGDLCNILNACTMVAIPSLIDNIPQTALESLACGIPVLTLDSNGVDELISDPRLGSIVKAESSPKAIAEQIRARKKLNLSERQSNASFFRSIHNNQNVISAYIQAYRQAISGTF
jgi:glycosyltransferase involved in cell wall biosynthesis